MKKYNISFPAILLVIGVLFQICNQTAVKLYLTDMYQLTQLVVIVRIHAHTE